MVWSGQAFVSVTWALDLSWVFLFHSCCRNFHYISPLLFSSWSSSEMQRWQAIELHLCRQPCWLITALLRAHLIYGHFVYSQSRGVFIQKSLKQFWTTQLKCAHTLLHSQRQHVFGSMSVFFFKKIVSDCKNKFFTRFQASIERQ